MAKTDDERHSVKLWLTCVGPPIDSNEATGTEFGLQDRRQVIHPGEPQENGSVCYEIAVPVSRIGETNGLRFSSPYVHGTLAASFLYLSWRRRAAAPAAWIKRLKIPLSGLTWDQVETASGEAVFGARVAGSGSGTVPLLDGGWKRQDNVAE